MTTRRSDHGHYISSEVHSDSERQRLLDATNLEEDETQIPLTNSRDRGFTLHEDGSYTYAYGPTGFLGLRHNSYALWCALLASIGGLSFGYDQGVVSGRNFPITNRNLTSLRVSVDRECPRYERVYRSLASDCVTKRDNELLHFILSSFQAFNYIWLFQLRFLNLALF